MKFMTVRWPRTASILLLVFLSSRSFSIPADVASVPLSPAALACRGDGRLLYIACATAGRVLVFEVPEQRFIREIEVPGSPSGLVLSPDNRRLYVTCAGAESVICVVDTSSGTVLGQIAAGHTTLAPVLSLCGGILYVCHRFDDRVSAIELETGRELWRTRIRREPIAAALTPDGHWLVVANHLNEGRADDGLIGAKISLVNAETGSLDGEIQLPRGSGMVRGVAVSPDGRFAAVTHLLARYYLPTCDVELGRMNCNVLSILDLERAQWIRNNYLDFAGRGAANPWAVAWSSDGKTIVVTHAGTHELSLLDAPVVPQKSIRVRARISLPGQGPRALVVAGSKVFVANYFSDNVAQVDLSAAEPSLKTLELSEPSEWPRGRRGEALFNDATLCHQSWQSCASCHDSDARADGLNWDLLNDGLGNPKNVKSLVWAHRTPPAMSLGVRADASVAVRAGIKHILFSQQPEEVATAIDDYLQSLEPAPSPRLVNGTLSAAAQRGRSLFANLEVGCVRCHPAPLFTDLSKHHVGTRGQYDRAEDRFDTPALVELWRTAPYLHDGSAATLRDLLVACNPNDLHGKTSHLAPSEIEDLVEYLLSL